MNLPLVLDIAISLIFIYLVLSLLACEIQEIITTLLQWRAAHLRRSIEILLIGGEGTPQEESVKAIVDALYNNPLIKNINQEAKEGLAAWFRKTIWQVGRIYRTLTRQETTFFGKDEQTRQDKRSAPSYIPSETFATTLMERLNLSVLTRKLSVLNLISFKNEEIKLEIEGNILGQLQTSRETKSKLEEEFKSLKKKIDRIVLNFQTGKYTLINSIDRIQDELNSYTENSKNCFSISEVDVQKEFINEITFLKKELFSKTDELLQRLKPGLAEIIDLLETDGKPYKELKEDLKNPENELYMAYKEIAEEIQQVIGKLPQPVRKSLSVLARQAQIKTTQAEQELNQFQKEIEKWFDRSMDRASGVYKRNAKGVAFLIGLLLAFAVNADTFHIISRLSKDTSLRNAITQNAEQIVLTSNCSIDSEPQDSSTPLSQEYPASKLDCLRDAVNQTLEKVSLPIGRSDVNLEQQKTESKTWLFPPLRRFLGWTLSGLAISMGAPFWFELLGKIINVRNTGPKPIPSIEERFSSN